MPKVVCLDPGHGVNTPGKRSPDGTLREYEFAGDVAARAKRLLEAHGLKVVLTRPCTADAKDVSLSKRVQVANDAGAAVFVSIHSNAHGNGNEWTNGRGYETYVYAYGGQAEKLARRLVDEAQRLIVPFGVPLRNPTVKAEAFYVLKYTRMPAVLIEHAFHTNRDECALLKRDDFRQACAEHIARAVCGHLGIAYDQPTAPKPAVAPPAPSTPAQLYRLKTGVFWTAESLAAAKKLVRDRFGWAVYEWAEGTYSAGGIWSPTYRLLTGTFAGREAAEAAAQRLREATGWTVYVVPA